MACESQGKNYRDRFRRRNRRSHELRLVSARAVRSSWTPARIQKGNHGTAQHGALHGGNGFALGGWYGFNAGSALRPDGIAANAFTTTTLATAVASFTWAMLEYALRVSRVVLGFCSGAVAGLVVITPACGYVGPSGAVMIGIAAELSRFLHARNSNPGSAMTMRLIRSAFTLWVEPSARFSPVSLRRRA
jgi:hypothetical protein